VTEIAKRCSKCGEVKPLREFYARPSRPCGRYAACKACETKRSLHYNKANPEAHALGQRKYRAAHPVFARAAVVRWLENNPGKPAAYHAARRAAEARRTPPWATVDDRALIELLYSEAAALTRATGIAFEVDHEIPLRGKNVSGLHVPDNLRVIARTVNRKKSSAWLT